MLRSIVCAAALCCSGTALAFTVAEQSCREGEDFIRNAALSRDYGISASEFIGRVEADLLWLKSLKPEQRWFAQDDEDAALLRAAVRSVFTHRLTPAQHGEAFRQACSQAMAAAASRQGREEEL